MATILKVLCGGLIGLAVGASTQAQAAAGFLKGNWRMQGVVLPIYIGAEPQPSMIARARKVYTDYERKGFFRIGVLPVGVVEGVTLEIRHLDSVTNGLAQLRRWLGLPGTRRLEFRQATIEICALRTNRVEAGRVRVLPEGRWELTDGVRVDLGTNRLQAARAVLQVAGRQTGTLTLATVPPWTTNLFTHATCGNQQSNRP